MSGGGRIAWAAVLAFALLALLGPWALGGVFDPERVDASLRYAPPSSAHWLGTDALGRDVLIRLLHAARASLLVAGVAALAATAIGASLGLYAGYRGGWVDRAFLGFTDVFRAVPKLPLFILLSAVDLRPLGLVPGPFAQGLQLVLVMSAVSWVFIARLARAAALELRSRGFTQAAAALGLPERRIVFAHLLPHAARSIGVGAALLLGDLVLYESVLSYLGLGFQPPTPSLGALLRNGLAELHQAPLLTVSPGLLTLWLVAAVHFALDAPGRSRAIQNPDGGVGEGPGSG